MYVFKKIPQIIPTVFLICFASISPAQVTTDSFNFQGELTDSSDVPITSNNVELIFSIFDPSGTCLLYQELQTLDLSSSEGQFSVSIGSAVGGTKRSGTSDPGLAMSTVFKNGVLLRSTASPNCVAGYTSTISDVRKIQVLISKIDGISVNQALSQSVLHATPVANMAAMAISYSPVGDWSNNNFRITNLVSPSLGTDAVNKTYADTNLKGYPISGSPVSGDVLQFNGTSWIASPISGGGGTVTLVTGSAPISVATGSTTPVISMTQAAAGTNGYLSSADWNTFNNKLDTSLLAGNILVGNVSNVATSVALSGDATINNAGVLSLVTVPVTKGGTGTTSFSNNQLVGSNGTGTSLISVSCSLNQVISFDGSGNYSCQNISALLPNSLILQNGNSMGTPVQIGSQDAQPVRLIQNGSPAMTIDNSGNIGIGTTTPSQQLHIESGLSAPTGIYVRNTGAAGAAASAKFEDAGGRSTVVFQNSSSGAYLAGAPSAGGITTLAPYPLVFGTNNIERMKIDGTTGNIGVGDNPNSNAKLWVNGSMASSIRTEPSGNTADFNYGNTVILQSVGGSTISLIGIVPGGKYTLVVEDITSRTYTLSGCSGTIRFSPANGPTTAATHTIYEIFSTSTYCYIKWTTGL